MIIGVDIGGTKIAAAGFAVDDSHDLRAVTGTRIVRTPAAEGGAVVLRTVAELINGLADGAEIIAVGVGSAGVVDADGAISFATDAIAGWSGFPLRTALADSVGVDVAVVNDVHAAGIAEATYGAGAGSDGMLMAAVGTGIGGAVVFGDGLRRGATGTAGALGHMELEMREDLAARQCPCGGRGHVEAAASGPALEQTYFEQTGSRAGLRDIAVLARGGDAVAAAVLTEGAHLLGRALASANALLDVDTIVIGGGVAEIGAQYLVDVEAGYRNSAMPGPSLARIVAARFRADAALTGAAITALRSSRTGGIGGGEPLPHRLPRRDVPRP